MELVNRIKVRIKKNVKNDRRFEWDKELSWCFIATYILGLAAHGYCYLNGIFSHDSMLIFQNDNQLKQQSGRFLTPLYREWRSAFTAPWLIGVLSLMWLSLAVYFLTKLFEMQNKLYITLVAGLLTTNYSLTLLNATYIHDADFYMASVFLLVTGSYLCAKHTWGFVPGGICFALSMGFYQANFPIAVVILMLYYIRMAMENENWKKMLIKAGQMIGSAATAFLLYKLCVWMFVEKKGIRIDGEYNSITKAFDFAETDIQKLIRTTVDYVYDFFMGQNAYNLPRVRFATLVLVIMTLVAVCVVLIKKRITILNKVIIVLMVALIPLALNSIYFISKGMSGTFII
ncbi:MAG: glucosyltransferase domain-containing protein [Lachnospiraceae bacterium]|nr:glucosyltransferase domain-containing protein [Lachnospiraceae bacterium]